MPLQVTAIMIGVKDLARSKKFYGEGLGCTIDHDYPNFVSFNLGDGSSSLALYQWEAAAQDAGVPATGSGFRGVSFHYIVPTRAAVDEVKGGGGRRRWREESSRRAVGLLRILQRPGRPPLEGRLFTLRLGSARIASAGRFR